MSLLLKINFRSHQFIHEALIKWMDFAFQVKTVIIKKLHTIILNQI